ncbi:hypothetical protein SDRG_02077 [Saprolegnia diclina VS20]|uniref:Uncharacterized protein n=1 Tax=Saprolegnia diclina (strain VS20) TaxID=1156394 RepID=T0R3X3_SAPDV|nr:hypothetical protein SDRG_02077 [Saprolegnia diclina VS20]EQC41020.1 hypothetical protein SDRG_02077 [Saprolegnia diclina VS20]|eukprot:XP_008605864.1 hypothetical protein SDRG_02077 [Saprolegnia diclina VS20]
MAPPVTFMETVEHLGGGLAMVGVVLALAVAYVLLVNFALPRGRLAQAERVNKLRRAAKDKPRRYVD